MPNAFLCNSQPQIYKSVELSPTCLELGAPALGALDFAYPIATPLPVVSLGV